MVFIKQRARTASVKTSGSAVPPAGRAYRALIWARGCVRRGGNLLMNIWLCSRATAPGPTCSASGSLIRARHRVRRGGVPPIGRAYRSLLSTASDGTDSEAPSRWDGPGSSSNRLLAEGKRLRSREMEVKWGSLLKSGSGVAPPHPARPAALPGPSFGLGTASVAAESLHDGKDP